MRKLDVLLINPNNRSQIFQGLADDFAAIENPIWAGMLASYLLDRGCSVEVLDANAQGFTTEEAAEKIHEVGAVLNVVVVYGHNPSASTQLMPAVRTLCNAIKEHSPEHRVLLVGGHPAALPERTLLEESADAVCDGEGFTTILELVSYLKQNEDFKPADVPGLLYKDNGAVIHTQSAELISYVPEVAWKLFPMNKYRAHNWHCFDDLTRRQPYAAIYTTLGCPFKCHFCCIQAPFKTGEAVLDMGTRNSYRYQDVAAVLGQIDSLVIDYGIRNIKIADELFVMNKQHVNAICRGIIERGYDLNIWAYSRVDTANDALLDTLKSAGVNWLSVGYEAGNASVRDSINKSIDSDSIYSKTDRIKSAGLHIGGNFIFGLPDDTLETMNDTKNMAFDLNCEYANFYTVMPYPGSKLYAESVDSGWVTPDGGWDAYSQYSTNCTPLPTKWLSSADVVKFRDKAWNDYYTSEKYLGLLQSKFGAAAVEHVKAMTSITLKRS